MLAKGSKIWENAKCMGNVAKPLLKVTKDYKLKQNQLKVKIAKYQKKYQNISLTTNNSKMLAKRS